MVRIARVVNEDHSLARYRVESLGVCEVEEEGVEPPGEGALVVRL